MMRRLTFSQSPPPPPQPKSHPWTRVTVLHKYQYVDASYVMTKIRNSRDMCSSESYLDCLIEYNDVTTLTGAFARVLQMPSLEDPDTFVQVFESLD